MIYIPNVQSQSPLPRNFIASADLRQTGDAWQDFVTAGLFGCVAIQVLNEEGARADQTLPKLYLFVTLFQSDPGKVSRSGYQSDCCQATHCFRRHRWLRGG